MKNISDCLFIALFILSTAGGARAQDAPGRKTNDKPAYLDTSLTFEARAADLVSQMTLDEKISQMQNGAPAIPRLGVDKYNWWSECLHGVARNGIATVFPQAIGMAATWDDALIHSEADVISTEARAKHNDDVLKGERNIYQGLTFWSPNVNIFRDPRWGRGQETYGEDPYLTSRTGVAFVKGLQGDDPKYFKVISTPKHYAVHSGPEPLRHEFDAVVSNRDLFETYLPAFRACVTEGGAFSVMGAYSALDGTPCCASKFLLTKVLRDKWGFKGYVVSDCGAIENIYGGHKYAPDLASASALAVKAGCDLTCGGEFVTLKDAAARGLVSEKEIDRSVERLMLARFKLGMFDPPDAVPYNKITISDNDTEPHRQLARKVADESIVLLKNAGNFLPLKKNLKSVAVIGAYADDIAILLGNYEGTPSRPVTLLRGIKNKIGSTSDVEFAAGYRALEDTVSVGPTNEELIKSAVDVSRKSDVAIIVAGISPYLEGEEMNIDIPGFKGGDRTSLNIPPVEEDLIKAVYATGKPVVLVLVGGSALAVNWEDKNLPAIVDAWYPGEEGGNAVADVLFGDYNPAGRLPITFYKSVKDIPPFEDYNMSPGRDTLTEPGRTYRYYTGTPLYPFGFGLSYTKFDYSNFRLSSNSASPSDTLAVSLTLQNTGQYDGDEVVELYVRSLTHSKPQPIKSLEGFKRVELAKGQSKVVNLNLPVSSLEYFDDQKEDYVVEPGKYEIQVGSSSSDIRLRAVLNVQ
ncbi:MAG TPA: glycoside hydrolase family 3 C-terminal domain-containing protein [Candidatus Kryptonia bacterium]